MTTEQLHLKYLESLSASIEAGVKCSTTGARYIDWLNSSETPATPEELEASEDRAAWLLACEEYETIKQASYKARALYKTSL